MKITAKKEELALAIQTVSITISNKTSLPVLSNILFDAQQGGKLEICATNLEVSVISVINVEVLEPGKITVPIRGLFDIIKEMRGNNIEISSDEYNNVCVKEGKSVFSVFGIKYEDFPQIPSLIESSQSFVIKKEILKDMIRKTIFSVSYDETRYVLNGIFMDVTKNQVTMVSTNGKRISLVKNNCETELKNKQKIIIPTKSVNNLVKLLALYNGENVDINITSNQIVFNMGNVIFMSKVIEGNYPDYKQFIPKEFDIKINFDKKELFKITHRVSLLALSESDSIQYVFDGNKLKVATTSQGIGKAEDEMDIKYGYKKNEVFYNPVYITDVLKNMDEDEVVFEIKDNLNPTIIKPLNNPNYVCVVLPRRF
jgi:DNA polymerase III subunit beta